MTKELFENVIGILKSVIPPREEEALNVAVAAPLWNQLVNEEAKRNEESVVALLTLALVLLAYFQQGDIKKIKEVLERLDSKELGTGIRVKQTPGPPS